MRGRVQGRRLPRLAGVGVQVRQAGGLDGEQGDLARPPVVRVPGELAQGVVADDDVGLELADVCDQVADGLVQGASTRRTAPSGAEAGLRASA